VTASGSTCRIRGGVGEQLPLPFDESLKHYAGSCLLSFLFALACPQTLQLPANDEFDLKDLFVVWTVLADDDVGRDATELFLSILLQFALVVFVAFIEAGIQVILEAPQDYLLDGIQRAIEIDRSQERFESIGEE
jgi:hypothetical protein